MKKETMELIDEALAGDLSKNRFKTLQATLKDDPIALQHYCEQSEIQGRLEWELKSSSSEVQHPAPSPLRKWLPLAAAAGVAVLCTLLFMNGQKRSGDHTLTHGDGAGRALSPHAYDLFSSQPGVALARITNEQSARWKDSSLKLGSWIQPRTLMLESGNAEITFHSGARILLEGPVTLEAVSPYLARMVRGKGVIHIPVQARGFKLITPSSQFTNEDCSFALSVDEAVTDVHVFKGMLLTENQERLIQNESARLVTGETEKVASTLSLTHLSEELPASERLETARYVHWSFNTYEEGKFNESGKHNENPYDATPTVFKNSKQEAETTTMPGPFNSALSLKGNESYLETDFSGITGSQERTICCWVRIPRSARHKYAYAIMSWGEIANNGAKWQLSWNSNQNGVVGGLRTEFVGGFVVGSTDLRDGKWHHIASVYTGGEGDVTKKILQYVDGQLQNVTYSKQTEIDTTPMGENKAFIGKRLRNYRKMTFLGDIDELYVFPDAFTPSQIEELQLYNTPPKRVLRPLASK